MNVAKDKQIPLDCEHTFLIGGETICGLDILEERLNGFKPIESTTVEKWDRLFNITSFNSSAPIVNYYQDIIHPSFWEMHQKLVVYSNTGKIRYVFSSISKKRCNQKAILSGYGAALNVKQTTYVSRDDLEINLFNHPIPDILTSYDRNIHNESFEIDDMPQPDLSLFLRLIKLFNEQKDLRFSTFLDFTENLPSYLKFMYYNSSQLNDTHVDHDSGRFHSFREVVKIITSGVTSIQIT
ncbi:UDP-glucose:glycoprotein glucosyltransferase 1 [Thelohanellus kitauei]|uniref:UDP-glucose:glycoprotein glucosyltransferase 1 n=1 Tax=Thelohanellus kitauei TaxID=669202 RepID=A0A0C2MVE9_THEKT|nr:UDP-glucose:glycoprotein glucosyltransferase 1 [Thelohanellus kitauei]